jgi:TRAP transporter TAXI family solute receptor
MEERAVPQPGEHGENLLFARCNRVGVAALLIALILLPRLAGAVEEVRYFRIGTAATTGVYFQIGAALASAITKPAGSRDCEHGGSCGVAGLVAVAQATQGSIENALAVGSGQLESALVQSDIAYWAYRGETPAPRQCRTPRNEPASPLNGLALLKKNGRIPNLRAIAALYPEAIHIVVRADGKLRGLGDLKGKRVALGEAGSGTIADARLVLEAAGVSECDLKVQYLRLSQAAEALASGEIDAFFLVAGSGVPAVADVAAAVPIRLLPIAGKTAERLIQRLPAANATFIPAGTYAGIDEDVATVSMTALWIIGANEPDDLVFALTKALWQETTRRLLANTHPMGQRIRLETALAGIAIPLHPGAARYYRQAGMPVPE